MVLPNRPAVPGNPPRVAEGERGVALPGEVGMLGRSEYRADGELRGCLYLLVGLMGMEFSGSPFTALASSFLFCKTRICYPQIATQDISLG